MGFSWQEYWIGLPFPPPGDLLDSGIKPTSLVSPALAGRFFTPEPPGKPPSLPGFVPIGRCEYSLEGLRLKLKLQYFGHVMPRADSLQTSDAGKD